MTGSHWDLDAYFDHSLEKFSPKQKYTKSRMKAQNKRLVNIERLYWVRAKVHLDQFLTETASGSLEIHRKRASIIPLTSSHFPRIGHLGMLKTVHTVLCLASFYEAFIEMGLISLCYFWQNIANKFQSIDINHSEKMFCLFLKLWLVFLLSTLSCCYEY